MYSLSYFLSISLIFLEYQLLPVSYVLGQCQVDDPYLQRLGKSRFFILHNKTKRGDYSTWEEGVTGCEAAGMKLAKVNSLGTDVMIGRHLEALTRENKWKDTWYWINAKFDPTKEQYIWQDEEQQPLGYTNFFYRQPRPTGVAAFITWYGKYERKKDVEQCIAIALPWPVNDNYGFQTSWDEKPCTSSTKRHALCEAEAECDEEGIDPLETFTEGSEPYAYDGNWIFGDRRYIVNWKPRTINESYAYCSKYGLELYIPRQKDNCFIPFLKLWTERITTYHFWTGLKYLWSKRYFTYQNGTVLLKGKYSFNITAPSGDTEGRTNKLDNEYCVSAAYNFEYPNQSSCAGCAWSMMVVAPANCNNRVGTICQHKDAMSRKCMWKKQYFKDPAMARLDTATVEFGMTDKSATKDWPSVFRSTYKQQFANRNCPPTTKMVRANNQDWYKIPDKSGIEMSSIGITISDPKDSNIVGYAYDYDESYWLVDDDEFEKTGKTCTLSVMEGGQRVTKQVNCNEWHFYLCENMTKPETGTGEDKTTTTITTPIDDETETTMHKTNGHRMEDQTDNTGKRRKRYHSANHRHHGGHPRRH